MNVFYIQSPRLQTVVYISNSESLLVRKLAFLP